MSLTMFRIGLRQCPGGLAFRAPCQTPISSLTTLRTLSTITRASNSILPRSKPSNSSITQLSQILRSQIRHASNVRQANTPSSTALNWNDFFKLRKTRRWHSLASSIISAIGVGFTAFYYISTHPEFADEIVKVLPIDPIVALGASFLLSILVGWLIGPLFGNQVWKMLHRSGLQEFTHKERLFFERIKKHRVNPMGASTNNPVPDFYGEKISSVSGYRQWLKDQRVFNRKREGSFTGGRASGSI